MKTKPMNTAPKTQPILLDVGYPWLVMGIWNELQKQWVYADLQADLCEEEWRDTYWQNDYENPINKDGFPNVFGWLPVPKPSNMFAIERHNDLRKKTS